MTTEAHDVGNQIAEFIGSSMHVLNLGVGPQQGGAQRIRRGRWPTGDGGECGHAVAAFSLCCWSDDVAGAAPHPCHAPSLGAVAGLLRGQGQWQNTKDNDGNQWRTAPRTWGETAQIHAIIRSLQEELAATPYIVNSCQSMCPVCNNQHSGATCGSGARRASGGEARGSQCTEFPSGAATGGQLTPAQRRSSAASSHDRRLGSLPDVVQRSSRGALSAAGHRQA